MWHVNLEKYNIEFKVGFDVREKELKFRIHEIKTDGTNMIVDHEVIEITD